MRTIQFISRKVRYQKVVTATGRNLVFYMPKPATNAYTNRA